jgi:glutathione S-transferase/maleylpyruvate isomerase
MGLTLYSVPVSLYCAKTRICLRHKGLTWDELPPAGGYGSDTYKKLVPSGNLPAFDDGEILLGDSEAIAEYVNERWPEPPMLPGDIVARAKARELGRFHDTRLEPALRAFFPLVGQPYPQADVMAENARALNARLEQLSRMLGDHTGGRLTIGDCGYEPTFMWIDRLSDVMDFHVVWPDHVKTYRARLQGHKAVLDEIAAYADNLDPWIEAKYAERGGAAD